MQKTSGNKLVPWKKEIAAAFRRLSRDIMDGPARKIGRVFCREFRREVYLNDLKFLFSTFWIHCIWDWIFIQCFSK